MDMGWAPGHRSGRSDRPQPFDEGRSPFVEILRCRFGLASKHGHINEAHLLGGVVAMADTVVDREPEGGYRRAIGSVAQLGIPGEMAEQEHFIHGCHRSSSCG